MYHLWVIIKGRRKLDRHAYTNLDNVLTLASRVAERAKVDRCEVSDICTGKIIYTVETVNAAMRINNC